MTLVEVRTTIEDQVLVWRSIGHPRPYPNWFFFLSLLVGFVVVAVLWTRRFRQKSYGQKAYGHSEQRGESIAVSKETDQVEINKLVQWIERQGSDFEPFWNSIERELTSKG